MSGWILGVEITAVIAAVFVGWLLGGGRRVPAVLGAMPAALPVPAAWIAWSQGVGSLDSRLHLLPPDSWVSLAVDRLQDSLAPLADVGALTAVPAAVLVTGAAVSLATRRREQNGAEAIAIASIAVALSGAAFALSHDQPDLAALTAGTLDALPQVQAEAWAAAPRDSGPAMTWMAVAALVGLVGVGVALRSGPTSRRVGAVASLALLAFAPLAWRDVRPMDDLLEAHAMTWDRLFPEANASMTLPPSTSFEPVPWDHTVMLTDSEVYVDSSPGHAGTALLHLDKGPPKLTDEGHVREIAEVLDALGDGSPVRVLFQSHRDQVFDVVGPMLHTASHPDGTGLDIVVSRDGGGRGLIPVRVLAEAPAQEELAEQVIQVLVAEQGYHVFSEVLWPQPDEDEDAAEDESAAEDEEEEDPPWVARDLTGLTTLAGQVKEAHPDTEDILVVVEQPVDWERVVGAIDAVRFAPPAEGDAAGLPAALFPEVTLAAAMGEWTPPGPPEPEPEEEEPETPDKPKQRIVLGSLDKSLIDEVVKRHMNQLRYCYQRQLSRNPGLAGEVIVRFIIANDGSVQDVSIKESALNHGGVESCLKDRFFKMQFPKPHGKGIVIATYPLTFTAGD